MTQELNDFLQRYGWQGWNQGEFFIKKSEEEKNQIRKDLEHALACYMHDNYKEIYPNSKRKWDRPTKTK